MLNFNNVNVKRGRENVLQSVSANVSPGELIAVIGENGAGKSTLLKAITGELPVEGELTFHNKVMSAYQPSELAQHRAVMSQHLSLPFDIPVCEFVAMGRFHFNETTINTHQAVEQVMSAAGLSHYINRTTAQLSGGEFQRLQLARCLAQLDALSPDCRNKLMLLDEPTSALDLRYQHKLLQLVKKFTDAGNAALIAIHDLNLAAIYASQIWLIDKNTLRKVGHAHDILREDVLTEVYQTPMKVFEHQSISNPIIYSSPN
ncbi:heme ABC transporter ATP-binding protein [Thalassotalea ganghwensis]